MAAPSSPASGPRAATLACVVALAVAWTAHAAAPLSGYDADTSQITVSGLSSGGYMAVQFHVAHSSRVNGAGIVAGGPYYCAGGYSRTAYYNCMTPGVWTPLPPLSKLHAATEALAKEGRIDATRNLAAARVWLFSGTKDETVEPEVVRALHAYYAHYGDAKRIAFVGDRPAGHAMVSADPDVKTACAATEPPFINRCSDEKTGHAYDAPGSLLSHLLASPRAPGNGETGELVRFDQRQVIDRSPYAISMADTGYVYVPPACLHERCRVHVAFHGCRQSEEAVGRAFVRDAGYNRWADAYRLIVLYPQAISRNGWGRDFTFVFNPRGCWDWWGYTGGDYHTKDGAQIRAVKAMVDRLASPRGAARPN